MDNSCPCSSSPRVYHDQPPHPYILIYYFPPLVSSLMNTNLSRRKGRCRRPCRRNRLGGTTISVCILRQFYYVTIWPSLSLKHSRMTWCWSWVLYGAFAFFWYWFATIITANIDGQSCPRDAGTGASLLWMRSAWWGTAWWAPFRLASIHSSPSIVLRWWCSSWCQSRCGLFPSFLPIWSPNWPAQLSTKKWWRAP